jgi:hypothetical protein
MGGKPSKEEIPTTIYGRMRKRVARLFDRGAMEPKRPLEDYLPTPYLKKYRDADDEAYDFGEKCGRQVYISWRDSGRRYWREVKFFFEPLHRICYRWFNRGPALEQMSISSAAGSGETAHDRKRKQESGSSVDEKRRKIDEENAGDATTAQDAKLAKVFEENDSDSLSNESDIPIRQRRKKRQKVQSSSPKKLEESDEDTISRISDPHSRASTPFYENFDELDEGSATEEDDLESRLGGKEGSFESDRLMIPEVCLPMVEMEVGEAHAQPLSLPYAKYSEDGKDVVNEVVTGKELDATFTSGYLADASDMHDDENNA